MDKRVIFAVAGSGKTTYIINSLDLEKKSIIITYTNNNYFNLKTGIIKKFGYIPTNIKLYTYYSFLHSFCYKPFLSDELKTKGINYEVPYNRYTAKVNLDHYIDKNNRLYSSRISKLLIELKLVEDINKRLSKYFDNLFIDEIQDFASNDFNLLKGIVKSNIDILFVGDFFQHTFDTSRDGTTKKNLHENFTNYQSEFIKAGLQIDITTLNKSWRCSPTICRYITENLGIQIESHKIDETEIIIVDSKEKALKIHSNSEIVKLFYQEHYKFNCFSRNWGDSKGEDRYYDVCVVMNKTTFEKYQKSKLNELASTTTNKFYVALSRTKNNLYLMNEELIKELKEKKKANS